MSLLRDLLPMVPTPHMSLSPWRSQSKLNGNKKNDPKDKEYRRRCNRVSNGERKRAADGGLTLAADMRERGGERSCSGVGQSLQDEELQQCCSGHRRSELRIALARRRTW
uniref:Uncharacterized protein n=1 Tax=Nelumbo nucifera TaxID=4432 RepID=A0A822XWG8_NELNU|nr:TPA_asm: hypothetical protein HUJ06_025816 [Nelumbo nucifera]